MMLRRRFAIGSRLTGDIHHERFASFELKAYTGYRTSALYLFYLFTYKSIQFPRYKQTRATLPRPADRRRAGGALRAGGGGLDRARPIPSRSAARANRQPWSKRRRS